MLANLLHSASQPNLGALPADAAADYNAGYLWQLTGNDWRTYFSECFQNSAELNNSLDRGMIDYFIKQDVEAAGKE